MLYQQEQSETDEWIGSVTCKTSTPISTAAKHDGGGFRTTFVQFQTEHSVTSNNAQTYGGEVMREVSLCSPYVGTEHTRSPWWEVC